MTPDITVAICTWNHSALLRQTVEQLTQLRIPSGVSWELLIVDNHSEDDTRDVAYEYEKRLPLRYVYEPTLGLCRARNRALDESEARFILFTDDDVLVYPDWIETFWHAAAEYPTAAAFGGPIEPWWVQEPDPDFAEVFWRLKIGFCGLDHRCPRGPLQDLPLVGANMAYRREAIGSLRFDPRLGQVGKNEKRNDEYDFIARLREAGGTVIWVPDMRLRHYVDPQRMTLSYLCRITIGDGRVASRVQGIPVSDSPAIGGVPRWLIRQCLEHRLNAVRHRLAGRRVQWLTALRDHFFLRGQISEAWLMRREQKHPDVATSH